MTVTADGDIIVAGDAVPVDATTNTDLIVVEYDDSGTLVTSFGTNGTETTDVSGTADIVNDIALETNGEIVVVGGTNVGANERFEVELLNTDGTLDTNFNGTGFETTHVETGLVETAADVAIEEDDGIVVAGSVTDGNTSLLVVVNYDENGELNATFGDDGIVTLDTATHQDSGEAVAIQSDGNIVVAGTDGADMLVVRYDTNGDLDVTFGDDGIVTVDTSGGGVDIANAVVIDPDDGTIIIGGVSDDGGSEDFAVVRLETDGSLDATFDTDGIATTDLGDTATETIAGLGLESNGDIVAAGTSGDSMAVVVYTSDGDLDASFSTDGILLVDVGTSSVGNDVTVTVADQIIVAGAVQSDGDTDLDAALVALGNDGSLDTSFGDDGVVTYDLSADNDDQFTTLLVENDGTVVAGGDPVDPDSVDNETFDLVQFNSDGSVDTAFGTNGEETIDFGAGHDSVNSIAEQSDGEMISVGIAEDVVTSDEFFGVAATGTTGSGSGCGCNIHAKSRPGQNIPQVFMAVMFGGILLVLRTKISKSST